MDLNSKDEQLLLSGVKQAVALVDQQELDPNTAMHKVAVELGYTPGFLKAACNAFNTGRQLAQWEGNTNILDKLAGFELADYDVIYNKIWGNKEKQASHSLNPDFKTYATRDREFLLNMPLPSTEKRAAEHVPARDILAEFNKKYKLEAEVKEAQLLKTAADDLLNFSIYKIESYFKKSAYDRLALAQVEKATEVLYGHLGVSLLDYVAQSVPNEKRAADHTKTWVGFSAPVDSKQEPYTLIKAALDQAKVVIKRQAELEDAIVKVAAQETIIQSFYPAPPVVPQTTELTPYLILGGEKEAAMDSIGDMHGLAKMMLGAPKDLATTVQDKSKNTVNEFVNKLESPDHINELRKIRAQTVLTQLMSDPEDPISSADPEQVLATYNELVQLSPHMADQPAALRPMLRKALTGNTEPFEVEQQLKTEKLLGETATKPIHKEPPVDLTTSPDYRKLLADKTQVDKTNTKLQAELSKKTDLMKNESDILS